MSGWSKSLKSVVTQEYYLGSCERAHQWGALNHFVCFDKAVTVSMSKEVKQGNKPKLYLDMFNYKIHHHRYSQVVANSLLQRSTGLLFSSLNIQCKDALNLFKEGRRRRQKSHAHV